MVNNNLSFDECKQMSSRLIAMNPNRNANMGQIATYLLDYYTELTKQSWLSTLVGQIRDLTAKQNQMGEEQKQTEAFKQLDKQITALKKQLPSVRLTTSTSWTTTVPRSPSTRRPSPSRLP